MERVLRKRDSGIEQIDHLTNRFKHNVTEMVEGVVDAVFAGHGEVEKHKEVEPGFLGKSMKV